ncbi:major facilitator superfamily domain-containing protein [Collybia nuda]|uniref:Major facilitator superfamily domain-containing protein n=1 Tax=Collybia nuda TaxID=64659 RepID=A0A9P5YC79_9AGAR|nr:major facilitator superfamily domain-containing protein [Collybia nuda]
MSTYEIPDEKASADTLDKGVNGGDTKTPVSEAEISRVLRKMDWHILPFVSLLYLSSFLDRANIGNAKIAGMSVDAHLDGLKYNIIAAVFFVTYTFAEVPSNIALKLIRPSRWSLAEGGLFPGITFYLSLWYRRRDVAGRIALFFAASTIAGAFGGLLAYGIEKMDGIGGLHGWQWIFCLEGIATVLIAFASYFYMQDYPETAKFLTSTERDIVCRMLKEDNLGLATHYDRKFVWQAMTDYNTYVHMAIYIGLVIPLYAIALFAPSIVKGLGYTAANAQLLTVPIFVAGCIATIIIGIISDRVNIRGPFVLGMTVVSFIGFLVSYTQNTPGAGYVGAVLTTMVYSTIAVELAWVGASAGGDVRKGVTFAMVIGAGNLGGVCSSFIYLSPDRFYIGHCIAMGSLGFAMILTVFSMWNFKRINKERDALCQREGIDDSRRQEFAEMGSESPLFRLVRTVHLGYLD